MKYNQCIRGEFMRIKEIEETKTERYNIYKKIQQYENNKNVLSKALTEYPLDGSMYKQEEIINNLNSVRKALRDMNEKYESLLYRFPSTTNIYYNRNMLGNEIAKLITDIMKKEYIYQEDYMFEIDNGSDLIPEARHINLIRRKIYTLVDKNLANHEPYMEYYDEETLKMAKDDNYNRYYHKYKLGYVNTYKEYIKNQELFILPFSNHYFICANLPLEKQEIYRKGDCILQFNCCDDEMYFNGEASINYYCSRYNEGYSKIINDFLSITLIKGLYIGRTLNEEEISEIREKFVELYKSGYQFEYYEDDLFKLKVEKVYEKVLKKRKFK